MLRKKTAKIKLRKRIEKKSFIIKIHVGKVYTNIKIKTVQTQKEVKKR